MILTVRGWRRLPTIFAATALIWTATLLPASADSSHVIQPGETLSGIADAYGVPLDVLAAQNHIVNVNLIFAGETLTVPGQAPPAGPPPSTSGSHVVQTGDTLYSIAAMQRTTIQQLIAANPEIVDPNQIFVGQSIVIPGGTASSVGSSSATPATASPDAVQALLTQYAQQYGIDPLLVEGLAWQESGWRQSVVSSAGAVGVMQIMPDTADWLASDVVGRPLDVNNNVADNIEAGVAYLRFLIDRTGTVELGVAAYYQGPGSLQRDGMLAQTQQYVANVMAIRSYLMVYGVPPV
jgi:LysM repeat protein